jgi:hypothetical protein
VETKTSTVTRVSDTTDIKIMKIKYFKLVPATKEEIQGKPFVAVWNLQAESPHQGTNPDWALHIQEGNAAVFNIGELVKSSSQNNNPSFQQREC